MKKVIITGATGMIGVSLINELLSKNIKILAIVRENSKRINNIPKNANIKIIECDLKNLHLLNITENDFDVFYHFAWEGTFGNDRDNKDKQEKNVEYTLDALRLAVKAGCKKFIGAGSQAEYGRYNGVINEETPTNPETEYGKAKLRAKIESQKLAELLGINYIWTRIFSVYGPYDGDNTMIMTSIKEMLNGNSPNYTKGEQNWDYLFSEDLAKMLFILGENGKNKKTYCLASGKTKKLYEYINIIKNIINESIELKLGVIEYTENQVMNLKVDIRKFIKDTGYVPDTSFEKGMQKTINWYKNKKLGE